MKNGAELLDRLVKDIVSESAATYVSVLQTPEPLQEETKSPSEASSVDAPTAFSLAKFIPLLQERIHVINPFTRTFLVSWVTLLDTIPDLELVYYLPAFLGGLIKFLSDPNRDVHVQTQGALERFLNEIKKIARLKRGIESRKARSEGKNKVIDSDDGVSVTSNRTSLNDNSNLDDEDMDSGSGPTDEDWVPGQDVFVDHPKILEILIEFLDTSSEEGIQLTALRWIDTFFEICPEDILRFVPQLLERVLPLMASGVDAVRQAANRVNNSLMEHISSLPDEDHSAPPEPKLLAPTRTPAIAVKDADIKTRRPSTPTPKPPPAPEADETSPKEEASKPSTPPALDEAASSKAELDLDYNAAVGALTQHFLDHREATRVAALTWLIMLHRKAPRKVLTTDDGTFPALLKTLSDPSEGVVTRDLQLLSQISKNSEDGYFTSFMENLLQLFSTDRRLLETRGNLIIRQLCISLSAERIYRTLGDCLEKEDDMEFASIMVQNLNNNLITAPELAELRKRLRNLETRDGQTFFIALFRSWCHNAVATFSLCLLAQAYEQAYHLLQVFAELEMTVNMLIQIDKLVQLLESPVFTYLRLQLLEPEKYPHLYKCLYGVLMLLPQSSAFAALKNRLNSVSAIGYLHIPQRLPQTPTANFDRTARLKPREDSLIKWNDLLDKFKNVQERARKSSGIAGIMGDASESPTPMIVQPQKDKELPDVPKSASRPGGAGMGIARPAPPVGAGHKPKSSLSNLSRLAGGVRGHKTKK